MMRSILFFIAAGAPAVLLAQIPGLKATPGFDLSAIDRAANPCDDFYQFACGSWLKNNPIPSDESSWGRFSELQQNNELELRAILEAAMTAPSPDANTKKIGDYYASCMDEESINRKGLAPLKTEIDRINAMKGPQDLPDVLGRLHKTGIDVLFSFGSSQDLKDSTAVIGWMDQGGIGLPERDYYFREDAKAAETRKEYLAYMKRLLKALNMPETEAERVMALETSMAKASMDVTSRRDPTKLYHMMTLAQFEALADSFGWSRYFAAVGAPKLDRLNVAAPDFFKAQEQLIKSQPMEVWQAYMILHLVRSQSRVLPKNIDDAVFAFYNTYLTGAKDKRPRWKQCVTSTDGDLGEALGKAFVDKTFGADGKQRTLTMVRQIEAAMQQDLEKLTWMSPETKKKALDKLHAVTNKIGYPDNWRDYSKLEIVRGDALGNSLRANQFEFARQLAKIGKPVDRTEWQMTPPTVNAYYDPQMNNINFPAGILQPPFFDKTADDATNFGAAGAVVGHELTHGFDDEGRQFDKAGNMTDWWTPADSKAFDERAQCIVDEYSAFDLGEGVHMNGKLTLGENTADNGGLRLALMALQTSLAADSLPKKDDFTPEQRFFLGYGQSWCQSETMESARLQAQTNPHALPKYRVNGVVSNMPEFRQAFACKAGQPMVRANACRVW
jgi:endothelin-converting enzyme/putative endopeptidase